MSSSSDDEPIATKVKKEPEENKVEAKVTAEKKSDSDSSSSSSDSSSDSDEDDVPLGKIVKKKRVVKKVFRRLFVGVYLCLCRSECIYVCFGV